MLKSDLTRLACHFVGEVAEVVLQEPEIRSHVTNMTSEERKTVVDKITPIAKKLVAQTSENQLDQFFNINSRDFIDQVFNAVNSLISTDELQQIMSHPYNGPALSHLTRFMEKDRPDSRHAFVLAANAHQRSSQHHTNFSQSSNNNSNTNVTVTGSNNNHNDINDDDDVDDDLLDSLANELLEQEEHFSEAQSLSLNSSLQSSELKDALEE